MIAKGETLRSCNTNPNLMEKQMNIKRAFLILAAVLLMPGLALAGLTIGAADLDIQVNIDFIGAFGDDEEADVFVDCENVVEPKNVSEVNVGDETQAQFDMSTLTLQTASCVVTVAVVGGWNASFIATSVGSETNVGDCTFFSMVASDEPPLATLECTVNFTPANTFTLVKDWDISGTGGIDTDIDYTLKIVCDAGTIVSPTPASGTNSIICEGFDSTCDFAEFGKVGTGDTSATVTVTPPTSCEGFESGIDNSSVTSSGSCSEDIAIGETESCTITNTSFFEGIPTLNQYGLAILALLMLGVGFVGFRRFV